MGQIFYRAKAREGPIKVKCKYAQRLKKTMEQFGLVYYPTFSQAAEALHGLGKVEQRLGAAGCLHQCWSPPVREGQSMLLSPTQENLAPQAWAIKRVAVDQQRGAGL